jgi:hypothetical protein
MIEDWFFYLVNSKILSDVLVLTNSLPIITFTSKTNTVSHNS